MARNTDNWIDMRQVVSLLGLDADTRRESCYVVCPNCSHRNTKAKKLNINFEKSELGVYRCAKCGEFGGPLKLWAMYRGINDTKEAAKDLKEHLEKTGPVKVVAPSEKIEQYDVAPISVRDRTYSALLSILPLFERHKQSLLGRGLTEDDIRNNRYRSVPSPKTTKKIALKLLQLGCTLEGVPGFYKDKDGTWNMVKLGRGIFIPILNYHSQIQGFQIRLDNPFPGGGKYIYLSSRGKNFGAPALSYVHLRKGIRGPGTILLTEGCLKADVASSLSGYSFLAVQGVNALSDVERAVKGLKKRGLTHIRICYDMDIRTNEHVQKAQEQLIEILKKCEIEYDANLSWNDKFKGIDDYLWAKKQKFNKSKN